MKLAHEMAKAYEEELGKDLELEISEEAYLPDSSFKTARQRAIALAQSAYDRTINLLTRAIIEHREVEHGEDKTEEKAIVEVSMSTADVEVSVASWWNN